MRRVLWATAVLVGLVLLGYALFSSESDEERILALVSKLDGSIDVKSGENVILRGARLRPVFEELFDKDASLSLMELGHSATGRPELVKLAAQAPLRYQDLDISIDVGELSVGDVGANLTASVKASEELRGSDSRQVSIRLSKVDGDWKIARIVVKPGPRDEPR
jgi:hypothetical protein